MTEVKCSAVRYVTPTRRMGVGEVNQAAPLTTHVISSFRALLPIIMTELQPPCTTDFFLFIFLSSSFSFFLFFLGGGGGTSHRLLWLPGTELEVPVAGQPANLSVMPPIFFQL